MNICKKIIWLLLFLSFAHIHAGSIRDLSKKVRPTIDKGVREDAKKRLQFQHKIAIAAIFRDEGPWLKEWIEYYKMMGVTHFYLYNNLSTDNFREVLAPYVASGEVELIDWLRESHSHREWDGIQVAAYQDALTRARGSVHWLAIVDIDEFFVPMKHDNLVDLLDQYINVGSVSGFWIMFGTSHVAKIPHDKLMIETLVMNSGLGDKHIQKRIGGYKSIHWVDRTESIPSPHYGKHFPGFEQTWLSTNTVRINHYWSRDEDFLINHKIARRNAWGNSEKTVLRWAAAANYTTAEGIPILRFVPELRKRMGFPED